MTFDRIPIGKIKYILAPADFLTAVISFYLAYYWRFDGAIPGMYYESFARLWLIYGFIKLAVFFMTGIYRRVWRYAVARDLIYLAGTVFGSILLLIAAGFYLQVSVPRSIFIFTCMLDIMVTGGIRVIPKLKKEKGKSFYNGGDLKRLLVIGAGDAGVLVVKELFRQENPTMVPVGFIDDDEDKKNLKILGLPVLGTREMLNSIVQEHSIQEVLIAMPSAPGHVIRDIYESCRKINVSVRTLPRMYDIINGQISVDLIREVKLEDLLGREPVQLDMKAITTSFNNKSILVTGAGGSIGSELCRQLCRCNPQVLYLLGHDENPIFEIELELKNHFPHLNIKPVIADIKDVTRVCQVFEDFRPQVVFHAAAHKHVPLMEENPGESFKNNVLGTKNVAEAADKYHAETFVLISTDKAVNPSSVMGATKRIAEIIIQQLDKISQTKYTAVRFGNVLGSRGSVIPIFQEQIKNGGPVTVTHPDMRRYFMTIPEAVQLVLQAASMSTGGEIFILDMGEPVKIVDMARELIRLSGFEPERDIAIEYTGVRPGEKMYEEILTSEEGTSATRHKRIYVAKNQDFDEAEIEHCIREFHQGKRYERESVFELLSLLEKCNLKTNHSSNAS